MKDFSLNGVDHPHSYANSDRSKISGWGGQPIGGADLWCGHFSAEMYVKMKELHLQIWGVLGTRTPYGAQFLHFHWRAPMC